MENRDLELGKMIQQNVNSLLYRVENQDNEANRISPSIYIVPSVLRDVSPSSFKPQVVAIGPLHREDEDVQAFEQQKASYLSILMSRINSPREEILKSCMVKAYASMKEIKACYAWTTYVDAEIAEMMVIDACFILGFMLRFGENAKKSYSGRLLQFGSVLHDMILLENQIPIFFLNKIFQCTVLKFEPNTSLVDLIHPVFHAYSLFDDGIKTDNISIDTTHHLLGLLQACYAPDQYFTDIKSDSLSSLTHSAVNLDRAGVNFKPNLNPAWPMQMKVETYRFPHIFGSCSIRKTNFRMPRLTVHDYTEMLLRNLIAYEQSFQTCNYITSYATAMDMLVNTQEDVAKLVDSGVLVNIMGSNEEATSMINSICKNVSCVEFFYDEEWKTLNKYCNSYWPKHIAKMRNTYFSSPWSMIALVAGIVIFALTVVQTIFTIKSAGNN